MGDFGVGIFYWVVGIWQGVSLTIWTFFKVKNKFCKYWTLFKIKICMTSVDEEYVVKIKMVASAKVDVDRDFIFQIVGFPRLPRLLPSPHPLVEKALLVTFSYLLIYPLPQWEALPTTITCFFYKQRFFSTQPGQARWPGNYYKELTTTGIGKWNFWNKLTLFFKWQQNYQNMFPQFPFYKGFWKKGYR